MRLHYWRGFKNIRNFGDELNPLIWNNRFPGFFDDSHEELFVGIGTLINQRIPISPKVVIMGAGVGYGDIPKGGIVRKWEIFFVRGSLSAEKLAISKTLAASDPAILLHRDFSSEVEKKYPFAYMPHWANMSEEWELVCEELGFKLISPIDDVQTVIKGIKGSQTL